MRGSCTSAVIADDDDTGHDTDPCRSLESYEEERIERLRVCEPWHTLLGPPDAPGLPMTHEGTSGLVYGRAGSYKTTLLLQLAASVKGSVWLPLERGQGPSMLKSLATRIGLEIPPTLRVLPPATLSELCSALRARERRMVVVDSISTFDYPIEAWEAIRDACPGASFWSIVHVTKNGKMSGAERLRHLVDIIVSTSPTRIRLLGKRFGPPTSVPNPFAKAKGKAP